MKLLDGIIKKLPKIADRYTEIIASSIERKAIINYQRAMEYVSDSFSDPIIYKTHFSDSEGSGYEVNVVGHQVGFIEFGTGITTDRYPWGITVYDYVPKILHEKDPPRGSYGKGKGNQKHWGFYPEFNGKVATKNGDFLVTYKVKHLKDGSTKVKELKKPVIITHGLPPSRALYKAVKDTLAEREENLYSLGVTNWR